MADWRRFDLNLLRVLAALLDESQVSIAARRLKLSQPATSAALSRLRHALADPLLVRKGNQMVLTRRGRELRPKVRQLLQEIDATLQAPERFEAAESHRTFRVAANDYAVAAVLSPLLERLQRCARQVTTEILPLEDEFERRLEGDDYDLAIRDRWSLRSTRRLETLFTEEYVCIARRDHPRLSRTPTLDEFLREGHVLIAPRGRSPGVVDKALEPLKRTRKVAVTLPHFLAAPAIISKTEYVMTLPCRAAERLLRVYALRMFRPPIDLRGFDVAMAWRAGAESDAGISWLMEQIRQAVATSTTAYPRDCAKPQTRGPTRG